MILYRTQPKNSIENTIVNLATKEKLLEDFRDSVPKFQGKDTKFSDITTLVTDASILDGMIATSGYQNILVVPSFQDHEYSRLRDRNYRPINSAGDHLFPVVHMINETHGNLYVAQPKVGNIFTEIYEKYDVNMIRSDSWFKIDSSFKMPKTDVKFDAVVLLGNEGIKRGSFRAQDVKKKFAKYCTDNFQLVDVYRGDLRKLNGGSKEKPNAINRLITSVNTPKVIYSPKEKFGISSEVLEQLQTLKGQLQYHRLVDNLKTIDQWYKVYE